MEPINLRPLLKTILLLGESPVSENELGRLGFSVTRARRILDTLSQIRLVSKARDRFELSEHGREMLQWIKQKQWLNIDKYLARCHPAYKRLKDVIIRWYELGNEKGIPRNEVCKFEKRLLKEGYVKDALIINDVILAFLIDWGERLGGVMENKLSKPLRLYLLSEQKRSEKEYELLKNTYLLLAGKGLGEKYYLPIPWFREYSCELLRIPRELFDVMLIDLHEKKPKCISLFGAPETTITLEEAGTIRQIAYLEDDILEVSRSPLYGLKLNNSTFYYVHLEVDKL